MRFGEPPIHPNGKLPLVMYGNYPYNLVVPFKGTGENREILSNTIRGDAAENSFREQFPANVKMQHKVARLDLRLDPDIKNLAARASALVGSKTLSDFVVQAIREKASRAIEEAEVVRLNSEAFAAFKATCESPEMANEALSAAMRRRHKRKQEGAFYRRTEQEASRP